MKFQYEIYLVSWYFIKDFNNVYLTDNRNGSSRARPKLIFTFNISRELVRENERCIKQRFDAYTFALPPANYNYKY